MESIMDELYDEILMQQERKEKRKKNREHSKQRHTEGKEIPEKPITTVKKKTKADFEHKPLKSFRNNYKNFQYD